MKALYLYIALCFYGLAFSQSNTIESFIPKGWKQIAIAKGDLNSDNSVDVAIVVEDCSKKNLLVNNEGMGHNTLNVNLRRIIILFKDGQGYSLKTANTQFIPSENDGEDYCLNDPFVKTPNGFFIKQGVLIILFKQEAVCGRYNDRDRTYKFRLQQKDFVLIGYDEQSWDKQDGNIEKVSINFLNRKKSVTTGGNDFNEQLNHPKTVSKTFKLQNLIPLSALERELENQFDF